MVLGKWGRGEGRGDGYVLNIQNPLLFSVKSYLLLCTVHRRKLSLSLFFLFCLCFFFLHFLFRIIFIRICYLMLSKPSFKDVSELSYPR